jgi:hypothetical protein
MSFFAPDSKDRLRPGPLGHQAKIGAALHALRAQDRALDYLRLGEIHRRICAWLKDQGLHAREMPSSKAVSRYIAAETEAAAREDAHASRPNRPNRPNRPVTSGDGCD